MIECTQLFKLLDDFCKGRIWSFWSHVFALFFLLGGGGSWINFRRILRKNLVSWKTEIASAVANTFHFTGNLFLMCAGNLFLKRNFHPEHFKKTYTPEDLTAKTPENWWSIRRSFPIGEGGNFSGAGTVKLREGRLLPLKATMERKWNTSERCKSSSSSVFVSRSGTGSLSNLLETNGFFREGKTSTRPKSNISRENWWLEDEISFWFWDGPFLGDMFIFRGINDEPLSFGVYFFLFSGANWLLVSGIVPILGVIYQCDHLTSI